MLMSLVLAAAAADDAELATEVQRLVRRLDADDRRTREEAKQRLIALGRPIFDHLPDNLSPAAKNALSLIRAELEAKAAQDAVAAARVTLSGRIRLSKVMEELQQQSGNALVDYRGRFGQVAADPELDVDFDKTPFWEALDAVLDKAELTVYAYAESGAIAYVARPDGASPRSERAVYDQAFRVEAMRLSATRDFRRAASSGMQLAIQFFWEPRLRPISIELPLKRAAAVTAEKDPVPVTNPMQVLEAPVESSASTIEMAIPFDLPPRAAKKLGSVTGRFDVLVTGREETFRFQNLPKLKDAVQRSAGVVVAVEETRKNGDAHEVFMRVQFDKAFNSLESHRGWIFRNEAYLVGPDGNRIDNAGFETTRQGSNEVGLSYKFAVDGDWGDYTFVYKTPAAIVKLPVTFTFRDLPLP